MPEFVTYFDEAVLNGLLSLASDPLASAGVRRDAAQALGQLGRTDEVVLNGLLSLASDPKVSDLVRSAAAQALGQLLGG
ncbi:MAG: HEAT repeat domain-containing protein [Ardenticatenaceae bacterium]|nr:HEAT repeat domain-containing protein [Ardenticatenaceae bacterium]